MNRREFLALGAVAVAARAFGELKVFDLGLADETVLKIEPIEVDLGLGKAFKALHFSDTHLNFFDAADATAVPARKPHLHRRWVRFPQAVQSFYATLDYARQRGLPLLHTGDLIDCVTDGNDRFLAHNVVGLDWHYAIGNHEYHDRDPARDGDGARQRGRLQKFFKGDLTVSSRVIGGANFVAFDNGEAQVREETIRRVKAEFEKGLPVVLMCHIPPFYTPTFLNNSVATRAAILRGQGYDEKHIAGRTRPTNIWGRYDQKTRDFYTWLQTKSQLKAILCGHTHCAERDGFSETADMVVAGGNYEGRGYEITFK